MAQYKILGQYERTEAVILMIFSWGKQRVKKLTVHIDHLVSSKILTSFCAISLYGISVCTCCLGRFSKSRSNFSDLREMVERVAGICASRRLLLLEWVEGDPPGGVVWSTVTLERFWSAGVFMFLFPTFDMQKEKRSK